MASKLAPISPDLWEMVLEFFESNELRTQLWFKTDNPMLGNVSPIKMLAWGREAKLRRFIEHALSENKPAPDADEGQ